jgi:hypothetical protein
MDFRQYDEYTIDLSVCRQRAISHSALARVWRALSEARLFEFVGPYSGARPYLPPKYEKGRELVPALLWLLRALVTVLLDHLTEWSWCEVDVALDGEASGSTDGLHF